jgi:hypothetical protein
LTATKAGERCAAAELPVAGRFGFFVPANVEAGEQAGQLPAFSRSRDRAEAGHREVVFKDQHGAGLE